jgi:hypothetical protein
MSSIFHNVLNLQMKLHTAQPAQSPQQTRQVPSISPKAIYTEQDAAAFLRNDLVNNM